jgi:hypothetical protein
MSEIFVTNGNDFVHTDAYDGVEYTFNTGEKVPVPRAAAEHMFGYGNANKTEALVRLGWANTFDEKKGWVESPDGVAKLRRFRFTQGMFVEVPVDDDEPMPSKAA